MPLGLFFVRRYRLVPSCRIPKQLSLDPGITICKIFLKLLLFSMYYLEMMKEWSRVSLLQNIINEFENVSS